ncbi:MAG TPA: cytochrome c-type biogenesis protein [Anaerolineae bacterium]
MIKLANRYAMRITHHASRFTFYVLRFTHHASRITLFVLMFLLLAAPTAAQDPVTDDEVNDVAKGLYCPVCESTPLDVCPTQACADWRELIRTKLGEGQSKEEIYEYFARQYGDGVLAAPPRRGFNLVLWFFPVVAILVGGFFFSRFMGRLRTTDGPTTEPHEEEPDVQVTTAAPLPMSDEYVARVEQELQER